MRPGHLAILASILTGLWLAWSGHYAPLTLALGAGSLVLVLVLCVRMGIVDEEGVPVGLHYLRVALYVPWLAWEIVKANVDVARRILSPELPIAPRVVRVRASQKSELTRVIFANSITLTPGTISMDVEGDEVVVHALHAEAARGVRDGRMDRKCAELGREPA
jgi:multicomponent Na+:H+ antiporter subunit E